MYSFRYHSITSVAFSKYALSIEQSEQPKQSLPYLTTTTLAFGNGSGHGGGGRNSELNYRIRFIVLITQH
jgi:hypothetical protein